LFTDDKSADPPASSQGKTTLPMPSRAALREDRDVILVGEMRDLETVQLAISAQRQVAVFTARCIQVTSRTVDRMVDVFPAAATTDPRPAVSNSLVAVFRSKTLDKIPNRVSMVGGSGNHDRYSRDR